MKNLAYIVEFEAQGGMRSQTKYYARDGEDARRQFERDRSIPAGSSIVEIKQA